MDPIHVIATIIFQLYFLKEQIKIQRNNNTSVSASSATPSWFWSIEDKPSWGTNVFVRIAGKHR